MQRRPNSPRARLITTVLLCAGALTSCGGSGDEVAATSSVVTTGTTASTTAGPTTTETDVTTTTTTSTTSTADTVDDGITRIEVTFTAGAVSVAETRYEVEAGSIVVVTATSDVSEEVHVHGFNHYLDLEPGVPSELEFQPTSTGIFEVELENSGQFLFELEVTSK